MSADGKGSYETPYPARLARLADGKPLVVAGWALPAAVRKAFAVASGDDVVVEPDGTVNVVQRRHVGDTVRYFRADDSEAPP